MKIRSLKNYIYLDFVVKILVNFAVLSLAFKVRHLNRELTQSERTRKKSRVDNQHYNNIYIKKKPSQVMNDIQCVQQFIFKFLQNVSFLEFMQLLEILMSLTSYIFSRECIKQLFDLGLVLKMVFHLMLQLMPLALGFQIKVERVVV